MKDRAPSRKGNRARCFGSDELGREPTLEGTWAGHAAEHQEPDPPDGSLVSLLKEGRIPSAGRRQTWGLGDDAPNTDPRKISTADPGWAEIESWVEATWPDEARADSAWLQHAWEASTRVATSAWVDEQARGGMGWDHPPPADEASASGSPVDPAPFEIPASEGGSTVAAIEAMDPGPSSMVALSGIDPWALDGEQRVAVLVAYRRLISHLEGRLVDTVASIVDAYRDELGFPGHQAPAGAAAEIQTALRMSRRAADDLVATALALSTRLPQISELLLGGDLDLARARAIAMEVEHLEPDMARAVVSDIAPHAPKLTTGQLRARIRRRAAEIHPENAAARYHHAVDRRRFIAEQGPNGTIHLLGLDLPADRAAAAADRIDALARALRRGGETRSMDQLRADVALDLLTGGEAADTVPRRGGSAGRRGAIELHIDLTTLMGLDQKAADPAGYGPLCADIARNVVAERTGETWRWTVTHQGRPIATGTTNRRPTTGQRRHVTARHVTCVFPGCRMPGAACDLDHTTEWAATGATHVDELAPACRHHHVVRHRYGWTYRVATARPNATPPTNGAQRKGAGADAGPAITWISPLGRITARGP